MTPAEAVAVLRRELAQASIRGRGFILIHQKELRNLLDVAGACSDLFARDQELRAIVAEPSQSDGSEVGDESVATASLREIWGALTALSEAVSE